MGNAKSAHSKLLTAVATDNDQLVRVFLSITEDRERYRLLATKTVWANKTCLHLCAKQGKERPLAAILGPLVDAVANEMESGCYPGTAARHLSKLLNMQQREGRTPLLSACCYGNWNCAEQLIEAGSNIFAVEKDGNSALHLAAVNGHAEVVEQLLAVAEHQAITNRIVSMVNLSGFTPLHYAAWAGHIDITKQLLAAGVDPLQANWGEYDKWLVASEGSTALHAAALQLKSSICMILLQHYVLQLLEWLPGDPVPVDPRTRTNYQGHTPHHAAIWKGLEPNSQLALLLNPNIDIRHLFSFNQVQQQNKKTGPPTLRVIASAAVKHHLLQQLTALEDQHQHQLHARSLQIQLHAHQKQQERRSQQHILPGPVQQHHHHKAADDQQQQQQHWRPHISRVASSKSSSAVGATSAAAAGDSSSRATGCSQNTGVCRVASSKSTAGAVCGLNNDCGCNASSVSGSEALLEQRQRQVAEDRQEQLAAVVDAVGLHLKQPQAYAGGKGAALGEIEPAEDVDPASLSAAAAGGWGGKTARDLSQSQQETAAAAASISQQGDAADIVLTHMLAPGNLVARGCSRARSSSRQAGLTSNNSSCQQLLSLDSSKHSRMTHTAAVTGLPATPAGSDAESRPLSSDTAVSGTAFGTWSPRRIISRTASRSASHSSSSRRCSKEHAHRDHSASLAAGAGAASAADRGVFAGAVADLDPSAVFGATPQHMAQLLRDFGATDPSSLSYRHLAASSRAGSLVAATSLAGALPGCVSERLGHCLEGTVLTSFVGATGLVVGMNCRIGMDSTHVTGGDDIAEVARSAAPGSTVSDSGNITPVTGQSTPRSSAQTGHAAGALLRTAPLAADGAVRYGGHSTCLRGVQLDLECGVCLDRPPAVALAACGHALCFECARCISGEGMGCRIPLCPFCRKCITGFELLPLAMPAGQMLVPAAANRSQLEQAAAAAKAPQTGSGGPPILHAYAGVHATSAAAVGGLQDEGSPHVAVAWAAQ